MEYGAIDLHKKESQVRIVTEGGEVIDRRIATTRERFTAVFEGRHPMRILVEASTESEWVAQHLETLGHEVIVADPTFAPMYSERSRRVKTDRRDVAALTEACHWGCYRAAHRRSASQRTVQAQLHVRRALTDSRTRAISLARAITRGAGLRIRSGSTASFLVRVAALDLPSSIAETLAPLQRVIGVLNEELVAADDRVARIAVQDPVHGEFQNTEEISDSPRTGEPEGLALPRGRLNVMILLPVGSEPGEYEIQILDADAQARASAKLRRVIEEWCRCGGSIKSISVERDSFREEQLLQSLLVAERGLHPEA